MKKLLTIAGSDCSGGAGIQADLKTFCAHGEYGMSVITAITAQNTLGVYGVFDVSDEYIEKQIDAVMSDIFPDAIKIGMVSKVSTIKAIAKKLKEYDQKNVVVDPVMVSTSGCKLLDDDAINTLKSELFPLAKVITPNIFEAKVLCDIDIKNKDDMVLACQKISQFFDGYILLKGGHLENCCDDLLYYKGSIKWFEGEKIQTNNTHGTGCTLSSALAVNLARNESMENAVLKSKKFVFEAIKNGEDIGKGSGPLNHMYKINC